MKKLIVLLLMMIYTPVFAEGTLSDIFNFKPPVPSPTPLSSPIPTPTPTTTIPIDPPVAVPNNAGVVLLVKSILLRPEGVCLVVVYPTTP